MVEYKGIEYPIRTLRVIINGELRSILISVQSLSDALGIDKEEFMTPEENIDSTIYFYVLDEEITLPDNELVNVLDEPLYLAPEEGTKVILEYYMEIWYCYEDGKSMHNPLFTCTTFDEIDGLTDEWGLEVIQIIDTSELENEE